MPEFFVNPTNSSFFTSFIIQIGWNFYIWLLIHLRRWIFTFSLPFFYTRQFSSKKKTPFIFTRWSNYSKIRTMFQAIKLNIRSRHFKIKSKYGMCVNFLAVDKLGRAAQIKNAFQLSCKYFQHK